MDKFEIVNILADSKLFDVRDVHYKSEKDFVKYGTSFEAITPEKYEMVTCNNLEFKAKRIIEEFGRICFIYNGTQVDVAIEDIDTLSVRDIRYRLDDGTEECTIEVYHF